MAISDSQKVDYLWKKIGYSATKSDNVKAGFEEAIPSPLQIRGDKVMTDSGLIPGTIPVANTSILTVYTTSLPYECAVDGTTATPNRTWKTTLTDWISPEFGSTYQVKVWVNLASSAGNASTAGTSLSAGGSGNNDEWFFDYQAGLLHFIGTNLPNGVSFTGKSVYISGARYTGGFGVSAPGSSGSVGNLTISNVTISANASAVSSSANIIFSTSGTGAVQFTGNNAIGLPIGNIANRPTTVNAGYLRFNTEFETIEVWDGTEWVQTSGGVITSDVLSGDGSTATFALSANTTTTGVLVSINGTIQKPSTAYTVSNNSITFTETPLTGDSIEVRKLAGGTISVNYGNSEVAAFLSTYAGLYSNVQALTYLTSGVAGNILPSANVTYSLGSPTRQWKDLFVSNTTIYLGGIPLSIDASGNLLVNGSLVQGSGGSGGTNYSNVNVSALITTNGLTNYSNTNVAAYTTTQGYTNYSNVNVAAYLSTNSYLTTTTANLNNYAYTANITTANVGIIGYIDRANTIQSNQISAANVGIIGYIDLANTIQSTQISAANLGMRGYVDNQITTIIGSAPGVLDTLGELANALGADANLSVTITSQIANVNANITTANLGMKGYVDNSVSTANIGVIGYIDRANTIQSAQITAANLGIKGYIDNSTSTANIGMKGYVDSVATLSSYSNVNVSALITTNGLTNYSNVNTAAYLATATISTTGNITASTISASNIVLNGSTVSIGAINPAYMVVGLVASITGFGASSTFVLDTVVGNVNSQTSYNTSTGVFTLTAGVTYDLSFTPSFISFSNTTGGFFCYDWVDATTNALLDTTGIGTGTSIPTTESGGQIDNPTARVIYTPTTNQTVKLRCTNAAGTATLRGAIGTQAIVRPLNSTFALQSNITFANIVSTGNITATNFIGNGALLTNLPTGSNYSNVQVATYLPTYAGNIANIRLGVAGVLTFADSTTQTTAAVNNNFGNVNVSALITTNGLTNYSNVNVIAYLAGNITVGNLTVTGNLSANLLSISANTITGTSANTTITAGTFVSTFNNAGNVILPNVYVSGNVTATYFLGNGALLTGIAASSSYSNVQVATYLPTYSGVVTASNVAVAGNVTAQYLFGNGSQLTGIIAGSSYSNVQVATYLPTYSGVVTASNVAVAGNVTAIRFFGDGGTLSNVTFNVAGNVTGTSANVTLQAGAYTSVFDNQGNVTVPRLFTAGNIQTAGYLFGNGALLTGIVAGSSYSNVQVETYLPTYAGTVSASLVNTSGNILSSGLSVFGNTRIGLAGVVSGQFHSVVGNITQTSSGGAVYINTTGNVLAAAVVAGAVTSTGTVAVNAATGITTNQATFLFANASATTINMGGAATTIRMGTITSNVFVGDALGNSNKELTLRAQGTWNIATNINSNGGFNSPPYANQLVIGGSGTGMTANYSATGGYITTLTIYNPGTGYRNGDVLSVPGGIAGNTFTLTNYSSTLTGNSAAAYTFGIEGNLIVPGNVTARNFIGGGALLTTLPGYAYGNVNVAAYLNATGYNLYSNVNVAAYLSTATINTTGNITAPYFVGNGALLTGVAIKTTGSWTVPTGNSTQSFTVPTSGTYQLWVDCNIPNGILAWNATATVTNSNVPVVGQQFAWVYNGGGTPIDFTSIPNQFVGTGNTIVRSSVAPSATTNRFDFGLSNTSGGNVTVSYGYVKIS